MNPDNAAIQIDIFPFYVPRLADPGATVRQKLNQIANLFRAPASGRTQLCHECREFALCWQFKFFRSWRFLCQVSGWILDDESTGNPEIKNFTHRIDGVVVTARTHLGRIRARPIQTLIGGDRFQLRGSKFRPGLEQRPDYFALIIDRAGFEIDLAFNVGVVNLGGFTEGCITRRSESLGFE